MNLMRADERHMFLALQQSQLQTNRFFSMFADTLPVRDFFSESSMKEILRPLLLHQVQTYRHTPAWQGNPFVINSNVTDDREDFALTSNCLTFAQPVGPDLIKRTE